MVGDLKLIFLWCFWNGCCGKSRNWVGVFNLLVIKVNIVFFMVGMLWVGMIVRIILCVSFKVVCDMDVGFIILIRLRNIVFLRIVE